MTELADTDDDERSPGRAGSPESLAVLQALAPHEQAGLTLKALRSATRLSTEVLQITLRGLQYRGRARCKGRGPLCTWHPVIKGARRTFPTQQTEAHA